MIPATLIKFKKYFHGSGKHLLPKPDIRMVLILIPPEKRNNCQNNIRLIL